MRRVSIALLLPTMFLLGCPGGGDGGKESTPTTTDDSGGTAIDVDMDGSDADHDCDDHDPNNFPENTESCDGQDNDCDEQVDEDVTTTMYADADGDGFGDAGSSIEGCDTTTGYVANSDDCNDADGNINPDATELCDSIDNNCNDQVDEGTADSLWYYDADGDGYGDPDNYLESCNPPDGYVDNDLDCDDRDPLEPVHVAEGGYVDTGFWDTADTGAYGTEAAPYGSIQDGILASNACVLVHGGEYWEDVDFMGKNIEVIGVDGAENTFIYGTGTAPVVTFASGETSNASLHGFTISGGGGLWTEDVTSEECESGATCTSYYITYKGGGIYINGSNPSLADLIVTGNYLPAYSMSESGYDRTYISSLGGGIYAENANLGTEDDPESNIAMTDNSADLGGGLYTATDAVSYWKWAWIATNTASSGGGLHNSGEIWLTNSVVSKNESDGSGGTTGGGGAESAGFLSLTNVAVYANTGLAALYATSGASLAVANTIVFENDSGSCLDGEDGASLSITYSDVYGCTGGTYGVWTDSTGVNGNLADDPLFVDAAGGDFHLMARSVGVDAGDPAIEFNDADGTRNDMGAYGGPNGSW